MLGHAHPPAPCGIVFALPLPVAAEMRGQIGMVGKCGGAQMRLIGADRLHQCPEIARGGGAVLPCREKSARVHKGQRLAQIKADQRLGRGFVDQPVEHFGPRPAVIGADQRRFGIRGPDQRHGNPCLLYTSRCV